MADQHFGEALRIAETRGFRDIAVQSRALLSLQTNWRGEFGASIAVCRQVEAAAREMHDGFNELLAMSNRIFSHIGHGDYREALEAITATVPLARERENHFIAGRVTNTLGWLHQEFGDFERARELNRESADLAHRIKNGNVELRALINLGFDDLHTGAADRALAHFEDTLARAQKAFGAHRWRSVIHLRFGLAATLLRLGRGRQALEQAELGLADARATGSRKYVGWFHLVRGEAALGAGQGPAAVAEAEIALGLAQAMRYPTLTWQAAHLLARARMLPGPVEAAVPAATLAVDTLQRMAAAAPTQTLRASLERWPLARAAHDTLARLRASA
jgi:tetratricopeptide (TPR) repeat protein